MHGGAKGSGAQPGNQNALKHGTFTREAMRQRAEIRAAWRELKRFTREDAEGGAAAN
jgi:glucans biosynthesis protein